MDICVHGVLKRSCSICILESEVTELREENERLKEVEKKYNEIIQTLGDEIGHR